MRSMYPDDTLFRIKATDIIGNITEEKAYQKFCEDIGKTKISGVKIYDPRDKKFKISDNPALVLADMAQKHQILTPWKFDDDFWAQIAILADFCDKGTNNPRLRWLKKTDGTMILQEGVQIIQHDRKFNGSIWGNVPIIDEQRQSSKEGELYNMTMKEMCEYISKSGLLRHEDGSIPTPIEIFNYSPTGELFMIFEWYIKAKAAEENERLSV